MKLKIYGKKDVENSVTLRLFQLCDEIELCAVNSEGNRESAGRLLAIRNDGKLQRIANVSPRLGFKLGKCGRVKLEEC